jgi:hypothetical protein
MEILAFGGVSAGTVTVKEILERGIGVGLSTGKGGVGRSVEELSGLIIEQDTHKRMKSICFSVLRSKCFIFEVQNAEEFVRKDQCSGSYGQGLKTCYHSSLLSEAGPNALNAVESYRSRAMEGLYGR